VSVLGDLAGWRSGLRSAGHTKAAGARPDVAVATGGHVREALASGAETLLVEGRVPRRRLRQAGFAVERFLPLPSVDRAEILLPLERAHVARYALERWSPPRGRRKHVRNRLLLRLLERGAFPPLRPLVVLAARRPAPPFLVREASVLGLPADADWLLTPGQGDELARGAFHLFPPGEPDPAWIVKFARVPGYVEPFERDERGLRLAERVGPAATARAPRLLGRFDVDGLHASVETAAAGQRLLGFLHSGASRTAKLAAVESVASWLLEVARETAAPPDALAGERRRLAEDVLPAWRKLGAPPALVERVPPLPGVVQHNDLGSWNIVIGRGGFIAVDWESAREVGFPLWDLWYFLADALAHLDRARTSAARAAHFVRLFSGELPSSRLLHGWTRRAAGAAGVPLAALGPLATLCWLSHGAADRARRAAAGPTAGLAGEVVTVEHLARLWLSHPALGPRWQGGGG
jgi:hypothetical protein